MEYNSSGPILKPLLLIEGNSSEIGGRSKEVLPLPDGRLAFEAALGTLHDVLPSARTIYISVRDEAQFQVLESRWKETRSKNTGNSAGEDFGHDHDHKHVAHPEIEPIFDHQETNTGPATGLLAAHAAFPDYTWLCLSCDYPTLPPSALQQLLLEFQPTVTCFVSQNGFAEPLVGIWDSDALRKLKENVSAGESGLDTVIKGLGGKMISPLREEWIMGTNTKEEWEQAMEILRSREGGSVVT
ncbi:hypothetical protein G7Y89_g13970 [Cudoniella acicularis]|uniref:MobA-like NTP transferase domain-containing protein n=1 Tax=Cudoniella acicularis TaxID=354080 RepID=A0A8H4R8H9_9HELO|nr:hypothetical protein G7Y89_g13970 [Cudoniella acicularis]